MVCSLSLRGQLVSPPRLGNVVQGSPSALMPVWVQVWVAHVCVLSYGRDLLGDMVVAADVLTGVMVLLVVGAPAWESGQEDTCCPGGPLLPVLSLLMGFWVYAMDMVVLVWMWGLASQDVVVPVWTWLSRCGQSAQDTIVLVWTCVSWCECAAYNAGASIHAGPASHRAQPTAPALQRWVQELLGPLGQPQGSAGPGPSPLIASAAQAGQGRSQECDSGGAGVAVAVELSTHGSDRSFPAWPVLAAARDRGPAPLIGAARPCTRSHCAVGPCAGRGWCWCQHRHRHGPVAATAAGVCPDPSAREQGKVLALQPCGDGGTLLGCLLRICPPIPGCQSVLGVGLAIGHQSRLVLALFRRAGVSPEPFPATARP